MKAMRSTRSLACQAGALLIAMAACGPVTAATPAELLAGYTAQAGAAASPERGQKLFGTNFGRDLGLSCSSCHGDNPARSGKNELSGKRIAPLAPATNPARFTDAKVVENWFRQNCRDVIGRDCTAGEKADILAWLLTIKP